MNELVASAGNEVDLASAFEVLAAVPAESLWLANFTAENTRANYKRTVGRFIATMGIETPEALYGVSQGHVIAYREHLKASGASKATIANQLSALSSLYKFLADRQLCPSNPVSGVKRPHTGAGGLGSGKTPALTPPAGSGHARCAEYRHVSGVAGSRHSPRVFLHRGAL